MAKLSARGRTELVRLVKALETPESDTSTERKTTVVLMSDQHLLSRSAFKLRPSPYNPKPGWSDHGWKDIGKTVCTVQQVIDHYQTKGYIRV